MFGKRNPDRVPIFSFIYNCEKDDEIVGTIKFDRINNNITLKFNKDQVSQFHKFMSIYISGMHMETWKEVE